MHGFLRGAAVYTASNVASALVPFLLLPALTRAMSPQEYGQVAMFATLVTVASSVVGLSVAGSASVSFFDKTAAAFSVYVSSCMAVMLGSFVVAAVALGAFVTAAPDVIGLTPGWAMGALAAAAASFILQMRLAIWLVQKHAVRYAGLQVSYAVLNAGLTLLLVLSLHAGAPGRMGAQVLALAGVALLALVSLARSGMLAPRVSARDMKDALRFGLPLVPHVLGTTVLVTFDRFVINESLGLSETGTYMVAVQLALVISLLADAVNKAFVPWLYGRLAAGAPQFPRWMVRKTWLCFGAIAAGTVLLVLLVRPLVALAAGEKYLAAASVLPWLLAGQAFGAAYFLVVNYIFYAKRTEYLAAASFTSGCCSVLLTLLLVPRLGIEGAGISFFATQALQFALVWWCSNRVYPMPWFSWRRMPGEAAT